MPNIKERGFTLVELMASFGIMTLVLLSCLYLLYSAHNMSQESRGRLLALNAGRSVLEAIKDTSLVNVTSINVASYLPSDLTGGSITISTNPANLTGVTLATITVMVNWTGPKGMARSLRLTTMRSTY